MINWEEFEKDLHRIAETGRGQTSRDIAKKWKDIIIQEITDERESVYNSLNTLKM